jgi:hypothetical protein
MFVTLISVASVIDSDTLMVYAKYSYGESLFDPDSGKELSECSGEWHKNLDAWDRCAVEELVYQKSLTRH